MCGLAGAYSTRLASNEIDHVRTLIFLSSLRGRDSTGLMAGWRKKGRTVISTHKEVASADQFLESKQTKLALSLNGIYLVGAHARLATVGGVTVDNAHPYEEGNIVGVHNGHVPRYEAAAKKAGCTDSQLLMRAIDSQGIQKALIDAGEDAAYALQWVDTQEFTVNLIHNWRRPLACMFNNGRSTLYWASERGALHYTAIRSDPKQFESPFELEPDTLYTAELGTMLFEEEPLDLSPPKKHYTPRTFPSSTAPRQGKDVEPHHIPLLPAPPAKRDLLSAEEAAKQAAEKKNLGKIIGKHVAKSMVYLGWEGKPVPIATVHHLLAQGCSCCQNTLTLSESRDAHWVSRGNYICNDCRDTEFVKSYINAGKVYRGELKCI